MRMIAVPSGLLETEVNWLPTIQYVQHGTGQDVDDEECYSSDGTVAVGAVGA